MVQLNTLLKGFMWGLKNILLKNSPNAVQFISRKDFRVPEKFHIKKKLGKWKGTAFNTLQRKRGILWLFALRQVKCLIFLALSKDCMLLLVYGTFTPYRLSPGVTMSKETLSFMVIVTPGYRDLTFRELQQQLVDQCLILSLASSHQMKINLNILWETSTDH